MFKLQPKLKDGIISFDLKDKTTKSVTQFYEIEPFPNYSSDENNLYFKQNSSGRGNAISRIFSQIKMIFGRLGGEGGLFIMIGKKAKKN